MTLLLLLIWFRPVADFATDIQSRIVEWKERLDSEISMYTFSRMKYNICMGKCILDITREEDSETEDSGHGSSTESQSQCSSQVSDTSAPAEDSQRSDPHSQELHLCKGFQCFKRPKTPPPK